VTRLESGRVRLKAGERGARRYLRDDWRDETLPVSSFLVEHPEGLCLFDTGQTAAAGRPGYFPRWYPFFRLSAFELEPQDEVAAQLRTRGLEPRDVRWVVLSHLHTDHAGGIAPFAGCEVVVGETEWRDAQGLGGRIRGYLPQYWPASVHPRTVALLGAPIGPFERSAALTADGALTLVATPGHTRGHVSLLVGSTSPAFLLGGDLAHDAKELQQVAPEIASWCAEQGVAFLAAHDDGLLRFYSEGAGTDSANATKDGDG
jgi:N-acyl homoserine lactone hydrolase